MWGYPAEKLVSFLSRLHLLNYGHLISMEHANPSLKHITNPPKGWIYYRNCKVIIDLKFRNSCHLFLPKTLKD
jgi:hypothetical protein